MRFVINDRVMEGVLSGDIGAILLGCTVDVSTVQPGDTVTLTTGSYETYVTVTTISRMLGINLSDDLFGKAGYTTLNEAVCKYGEGCIQALEFEVLRPPLTEMLKGWTLPVAWEVVEETCDDLQIGWVQLKDKSVRIGIYRNDSGEWIFSHLEMHPITGSKEVFIDNPNFIADFANLLKALPQHIRT